MSERDTNITLMQIRDFSSEAVSLCKGLSKEQLIANRVLYLAVIKLVEMIGEASNRLPREFRDANPQIDWAGIVGIRNRLTHGYDTIDFDLLWESVTIDMPVLSEFLASQV